MLHLKYRTIVPTTPEKVFEAVTGYPLSGEIRGEELEDKYGKYLSRDGPWLSFREDIGGGVTWACLFEPPNRRTMRTVDSTWSDRIDEFFVIPEGTMWEITWDVKASIVTTLTKWLAYHIFTKRTIWRKTVEPALRSLYESGPAPEAC